MFLFDEPLSNLDAKLRVQMRAEIQQLHRRLKTTSLYVTHDQVEAMTLATRMIVMNDGHPADRHSDGGLRESRDTFVAGFIGSPTMNFLPARADGGARFTLLAGGSLVAAVGGAPAGAAVSVGLRPEHLRPAAAEVALLSGTVEMVEQLGADTLIHVGHGADTMPSRACRTNCASRWARPST